MLVQYTSALIILNFFRKINIERWPLTSMFAYTRHYVIMDSFLSRVFNNIIDFASRPPTSRKSNNISYLEVTEYTQLVYRIVWNSRQFCMFIYYGPLETDLTTIDDHFSFYRFPYLSRNSKDLGDLSRLSLWTLGQWKCKRN